MSWNGPSFRAGLSVGDRIETVNGVAFTPEVLKTAVRAAAAKPVELSVEIDGEKREVRIDYRGTLRYPRLERIPEAPDRLTPFLRGQG